MGNEKMRPYTREELESLPDTLALYVRDIARRPGKDAMAALERAHARLLATARAGLADRDSYVQSVVMDAIEQTIRLCDLHERNDVPHEARDVDYARILATAKKRADKGMRRSGHAAKTSTENNNG